ncbi:hypothetical protein WN51_05166 [Melipona quadrifasciata]|uniref:Uncharacterized protein n=1 Tax=Melipona quadrifasciata TaxID=166423 RepID=A0A0N0BCY1_9HYME|nr:hypothetical protein WN51_05166 [Melipona quadrifasciata]
MKCIRYDEDSVHDMKTTSVWFPLCHQIKRGKIFAARWVRNSNLTVEDVEEEEEEEEEEDKEKK